MTACKYGDPTCPCQDGDPCHYEGDNPMTPPTALILLRKPCDECGGTGMDGSTYVPATHLTPSEVEPCYACHRGWLPDDETVEAAELSLFGEPGNLHPLIVREGTKRARQALIAAARYQSEVKP